MIQQPEEFLTTINKEGLTVHYVKYLIVQYLDCVKPEDLSILEHATPFLVFNKQQEKIAVCLCNKEHFELDSVQDSMNIIHYSNLYDCYKRICN
jgi:hypothetical protein